MQKNTPSQEVEVSNPTQTNLAPHITPRENLGAHPDLGCLVERVCGSVIGKYALFRNWVGFSNLSDKLEKSSNRFKTLASDSCYYLKFTV